MNPLRKPLKKIIALGLAIFLFGSLRAGAQLKEITPDLSKVADGKTWKVTNATGESVQIDGKLTVRLKALGDSSDRIAGLAFPDGVAFTVGTIELDLKGKNVRQASFLGVAFNLADEMTFEGIYFRPFNFKADEPFRGRAVQYISWPENTWEKLRKDKPGQFENPINPVPDPDGWFHAKIEVGEKQVRVFVNDAKEPCLTVNRLAGESAKRPVGLFVDVAEGLYANLKIRPAN